MKSLIKMAAVAASAKSRGVGGGGGGVNARAVDRNEIVNSRELSYI